MKVLIETHREHWINYDALEGIRICKKSLKGQEYVVSAWRTPHRVLPNGADALLDLDLTPRMPKTDAKQALDSLIESLARTPDNAGIRVLRYNDWHKGEGAR